MKVSVLCIRVSAGRGLWAAFAHLYFWNCFSGCDIRFCVFFFFNFLLLNWSGNLIRAAEIQWRQSLITAGWRNSADLLNSPTWGQLRKSSDCSHESSLGKIYHPPKLFLQNSCLLAGHVSLAALESYKDWGGEPLKSHIETFAWFYLALDKNLRKHWPLIWVSWALV